jgi:hypothetical protein
MKRRALVCLTILLFGAWSGCAVDSSASPEPGPAWPVSASARGGRLRPGDTLHGAVTWEVADPAGARVVFANGAATVEWALTS